METTTYNAIDHHRAVRHPSPNAINASLRTPLSKPSHHDENGHIAPSFGQMVGSSTVIKRVWQQIELVAPTDANVIVFGESGTGKELIANAIHQFSHRRARPMVSVNCAAIPRELFESEFFGHMKGAFTGAFKHRAGRFESAHGGTLFLDEVGEIPLDLQSKLLRVLQQGTFERVGDDQLRQVDVRLITATNRDLRAEVHAKRFREDLYYRLNVIPIEVPPLRERLDDIPQLAAHFIKQCCQKLKRDIPSLTPANLRQLQQYDWPGNVRELQNIIERAVIYAQGGALHFELPTSGTGLPALASKQNDSLSTSPRIASEEERKQSDRNNIISALEKTNGKVFGAGGAAELLGIKPTTLASRMKALGIQRDQRPSFATQH